MFRISIKHVGTLINLSFNASVILPSQFIIVCITRIKYNNFTYRSELTISSATVLTTSLEKKQHSYCQIFQTQIYYEMYKK